MPETTDVRYYDFESSAQYLRELGFTAASRETIKHNYYRAGKLGAPKRVGRRLYWTQEQLDALVEAL